MFFKSHVFFFCILHCFKYEQWIGNEQIYLLKHIEELENENRQLREIYQTYQIQNEKCIRSIIDLVIKIILIHKVNFLLHLLYNLRRESWL